jgi:hypothetical protein
MRFEVSSRWRDVAVPREVAIMPDSERTTVWLIVGVTGAIALGSVLVPLRGLVSASNLAFAFVILTIVVAEMGGRAAGLATAVVSAMSLNFFLTRPYLSLTIEHPDDIVAFLALAGCGLVAAAFGRRRAHTSAAATRTRADLRVLGRTAERLVARGSLAEVLEDLRRSFGLGGLVLRRADERLVAAAPLDAASRPAPATELNPRTLFGEETAPNGIVHRLGRAGFRLPERGGRLRLPSADSMVLDVWEGGPDGLDLDERGALAVAALMIALGCSSDRL